MKKYYLTLGGITAITAIVLFIFGFVISSLLLDLTANIIGEVYVVRVTEPVQFWVSIGLLFASGALWTMILSLVYFSKQSASFSMGRYFIFLPISIITILIAIGLRLMFLKNIPFEAAVSLGQLQFLKWGFILNLLVCAAAVVFLLISRSRQNRLSKKG